MVSFSGYYVKLLLKVLSMFNTSFIYYKTIDSEDIPYPVGIMCINCGKSIYCLLDNQNIENFINTFVTTVVFQNIGLFCIIKYKNQVLISKGTVILGYLMDHGITIRYFHDSMVWYMKNISQLTNVTNII